MEDIKYINGTVVTDSLAVGKYETRLAYKLTPNDLTNKTTIYAELQVRATNSNYSTNSSSTPAYINGEKVHEGYFKFGGSVEWQVLGSREWEVEHNEDGTLTYNLNASFTTSVTGNYSLKSGSVSEDVKFPNIARAFKITATDANVESVSTINIEKTNDSFKCTLRYDFFGLTGTIVEKTNLPSYGWMIPTTFYEKFTDNTRYMSCTIYCDTYSEDTLIGTKLCLLTIGLNTEKCKPDLDFTMEEVDENVLKHTGTGGTYDPNVIKFFSDIKVTVTATPKNGATIESYLVKCGDGKEASGQVTTLYDVESGEFTVTVKDNRGIPNTLTKTRPLRNYIKLTANAVFTRRKPTDGKVLLNVTGNYYNGEFSELVFEGSTNTLNCKYRYREKGTTEWSAYTTVTPTIDGNTYKIDNLLLSQEFDYKKQYEFEFMAKDQLMTCTANDDKCKISTGEYIWFRNKNGANFMVNLYHKYKRILSADEQYPVGKLEINVSGINPAEYLYVGTWELYGEGKMLVGFDSSDSDFNVAGKTGGEKEHKLLNSELPKIEGQFAANIIDNFQNYTTGPFSGVNMYATESGAPNTNNQNVYGIKFSTGGDQPHNNMSPYVVVYFWLRIS